MKRLRFEPGSIAQSFCLKLDFLRQPKLYRIPSPSFSSGSKDERIATQYETEEHPDDYFRVVLRFHYQCRNPDDVGALHSYQQSSFWRRDVVLSGDEDYRRFFYLLLEVSGLPRSARESVVNRSIIVAHSMVEDHKNLDRKILPLAVEVLFTSTEPRVILAARNSMMDRAIALIEAMAMRDDDDAIARATRESMEVAIKFVPATKSSIEALEKATIVDNNSCLEVDQQCSICLETLSIGAEVSRMPCSHIFHGNCIVCWLESSNLCPLCRFAMPC